MLGNTLESPVNSSYRHSAASATNAVGTTAEGKTYTANSLNQYTTIDDFTPQYDADGNQIQIRSSSRPRPAFGRLSTTQRTVLSVGNPATP